MHEANPVPGHITRERAAAHDHMEVDGTIVEANADEVLEAMSAADTKVNPFGLCAASTVMGFAARAAVTVLSDPALAERVETADDPAMEIALIMLQEGERVAEEILRAEADRVAGLAQGEGH